MVSVGSDNCTGRQYRETALGDCTQEGPAGWLLWLFAHGSSTKGIHVSDARLRWLTVLVTAVLLVVVGFGAVTGSSAVASNLQLTAETALADAGLDGVTVDFAGREATLSGGSHADLTEAETIVEAIDGVRLTRSRDGAKERTPTSAPGPRTESGPSIELRRADGRITISGSVPDADAAAEIKSGAALVFEELVSGDLEVGGKAGSAPWATGLPTVFGDVVGVRDLALTVDATSTLTIGGTIESKAGRRKVSRLISATLPKVKIVNDLRIDPAGLSKADATVLNDSAVYFDQGSSIVTYIAAPDLDALAEVLRRNAELNIEIGGHAGPDKAGRRLSDQRVAAVKDYLVAVGVESDRLSAKSYSSGPMTTPDPQAEQFRRVDFIVKGN